MPSEAIDAACDPSQVFEQRLASICGSIAAVELKCEASEERRQDAEEQLAVVTQRCSVHANQVSMFLV